MTLVGHHLSPISVWTLSHWPPLSGYDLMTSFSSIKEFTHQIHIFPIRREGCCVWPCQRPYRIQVCYTGGSSLVHWHSDIIIKSNRADQAGPEPVKPCWLSHITSLFSMYLSIASRRICTMLFPGTEARLTVSSSLSHPFCPSWKWVLSHCFFQSPWTSSDCHDFSNVIKNGLETKSANSLRILGCISLEPIHLWMFRFIRWSWTWYLLTAGATLLL